MSDKALQLVPREAPQTMTVAEVKTMAHAVAESGLYPSIRTPEAAFTLMMLCQSEGLHPIQALRRYHIIEGRPSLNADAMLGDFQKYGGKVVWLVVSDVECRATFHAPGMSEPRELAWTKADAERADLWRKDNWKKYPRQMLRARLISEGIRMTMPSVVTGTYTPEEVADFAPSVSHREVPIDVEHVSTTGATRDGRFDVEPEEDTAFDVESMEMVAVYDADTSEQIGTQPKLTEPQLKHIHVLRHELRNNMSDDAFRKRLVKTFSKDSAALLGVREASRLIDTLLKAVKKQEAKMKQAEEGRQEPLAPLPPRETTTNEEKANV